MNNIVCKFIVNITIFSLILGAIAYSLTYFLPVEYFSPALPFLFPFFFSASIIVFYFLVKSTEKKFVSFINRFMLTTFLKLMIYMTVLLLYVFIHKEDAVPFILAFFILYMLYTVFEVIAMLKFTKVEKK
jgi:hypothetical protein